MATPPKSSAVLVDTNVFSYLMKSGDTRAAMYVPHVEGKSVGVSFVTVGELYFGAYKRNWGAAKIEDLDGRLRSVVIVPYDLPLCTTYASLKSKTISSGRTIPDNDLWIASCAVRHSIPLISHNRQHFVRIPGLMLISEA